MLEEYFGKQIRDIIGDNPERAQEILGKLRLINNSEEWKFFRNVIKSVREEVIKNFEKSPVNQELLIAYQQSLAALDFLLELPSALIATIELEYNLTTE